MKLKKVALPVPRKKGTLSLEEAIAKRRSVYEFSPEPLRDEHVSQLAWAAQGISNEEGLRTAPSAGPSYPLELYFVRPEGIFHYRPKDHSLDQVSERDLREMVVDATHEQDWLSNAPLLIVIAADYRRMRDRFGDYSETLALLEAGHVAQNILLQAVSMGLQAAPVGHLDPVEIGSILDLEGPVPIYLIPVGNPKKR